MYHSRKKSFNISTNALWATAALVLTSLPTGAVLADPSCPQFPGTFEVITSVSSQNGTQHFVPGQGPVFVITQTACEEIDVQQINPQGKSTTQTLIVDGSPHPWMPAGDAFGSTSLTSHFENGNLIGDIAFDQRPGQTLGTIQYSMDASNNTLTYVMQALQVSWVLTAVRK